MFTWIIGLAAGCIVLAVVLHFALPGAGGKVPGIVLGTVGGFAAGAVLGMIGAVYYGETVHRSIYAELYIPEPYPSGGAMKGVNSPPDVAGKAAPKKEAMKKQSGGGPGSTNLGADYPGLSERKNNAGTPTPEK